jgi:hypothetical protein
MLQVPPGRRDEPEIHCDRMTVSDAIDCLFVQDTKEINLHLGANFSNFI